jgi:ApaG protein
MNTAITEGVQITVNTQFRPDLSHVADSQFFFNYRITIENQNDFNVQLLNRDWYIFDSLNDPDFVSGNGVVGEQPILKPGQQFTYTSGCELFSELGFMKGFYTFKNLRDGQLFQVFVPTFKLIYPPKLN